MNDYSEHDYALDHEPTAEERADDATESRKAAQEAVNAAFRWLIGEREVSRAKRVDEISRRVLVVSFVMKLSGAPSTLKELGDRLGVSEARACQLVKELKARGLFSDGNSPGTPP